MRLTETPGPALESYFCVSTPPCKTDSHEKIEKINGTEKHQEASGAGGSVGAGVRVGSSFNVKRKAFP